MKTANSFLLVVLMCGIAISSCSQNSSSKTHIATDIFAGSTPCNPEVNKALNIPASDACAFMKWELDLFYENGRDTQFKLLVSYGDYQPNTPFFLGGGKNIQISGRLDTSYITRNNTPYKILHLNGDKNKSEILLIELDNNILHLIDSNMKLIKGDDSHAFILNRIDTLKTN